MLTVPSQRSLSAATLVHGGRLIFDPFEDGPNETVTTIVKMADDNLFRITIDLPWLIEACVFAENVAEREVSYGPATITDLSKRHPISVVLPSSKPSIPR